MICEARFVDGLSDREIEALFGQARDADYHALAEEVRVLADVAAAASAEQKAEAPRQLGQLRARLAQIAAIDFFGASGREVVEGLIGGLEAELARRAGRARPPRSPALAVSSGASG